MTDLTCQVYRGLYRGEPAYRAHVLAAGIVQWRGLWRERYLDAVHDAERMAETLLKDNKDVLSLKNTLRARPVVSGYRKPDRPTGHDG